MGMYVPASPSLMRLRNQEHVYPFPHRPWLLLCHSGSKTNCPSAPVPTLQVSCTVVFKLPARGFLGRHAAIRLHVAQGRDTGSTYVQYNVLVLAWLRIRIHLYLPGAPCEIHHYRG